MYGGLSIGKMSAFVIAWFAPIWVMLIILFTHQLPPTVEFVTYNHCWPVHKVLIKKKGRFEFEVDTWSTNCERRGYWR